MGRLGWSRVALVGLALLVAFGASTLVGGTWWHIDFDRAQHHMLGQRGWGEGVAVFRDGSLAEGTGTECAESVHDQSPRTRLATAVIEDGPSFAEIGTVTIADAGSWRQARTVEHAARRGCSGATVVRRVNLVVVVERSAGPDPRDERAARILLAQAAGGVHPGMDLPPT